MWPFLSKWSYICNKQNMLGLARNLQKIQHYQWCCPFCFICLIWWEGVLVQKFHFLPASIVVSTLDGKYLLCWKVFIFCENYHTLRHTKNKGNIHIHYETLGTFWFCSHIDCGNFLVKFLCQKMRSVFLSLQTTGCWISTVCCCTAQESVRTSGNHSFFLLAWGKYLSKIKLPDWSSQVGQGNAGSQWDRLNMQRIFGVGFVFLYIMSQKCIFKVLFHKNNVSK